MLINPTGGFACRLQAPILLVENRQWLRQNLFNQHLPSETKINLKLFLGDFFTIMQQYSEKNTKFPPNPKFISQ